MKSTLKKLSALSVSVAALVALGMVALVPGAGHADAAVDGFSLRAEATSSAEGGAITVSIDVGSEYKWNKDYPAKLEVLGELPPGVAMAKRLLKASDGAISATERQATAAIPWTGKAAAGASVTVQARFSICNDRVCLMKNAKVEVPLTGK